MDDSNIVEIYSAANSIDAYAMANALKASGIKARVLGEFLEIGAGGLPLGQSTAPRVCVPKEDEARAREMLRQWNVGDNVSKESA